MSTEPVHSWDVAPLDEVVARGDPKLKLRGASRGVPTDRPEMDCPRCHIEMTKSWNEFNLVCPKCQLSQPINVGEAHTIGASENHNTSSNAYMCFRPVGSKNQLYHHTMIKYTSEYEPYHNQQVLKLMTQYNFINDEFKIPTDVLKAACEMFIQLRHHDYVRRGMTRRGVLGACVYDQCIKHGVTKTKAQIAHMMNVEESKITFGLDELQTYHKLGVVDVSQNVDPTGDYVRSLFEVFSFDRRYEQFIIDLLERMDRKGVTEVQSCNNYTKAVGAVYFLSRLMSWDLTHTRIAESCNGISRGTYLNVSTAIAKNEKKLRKPFVRHDVPFPAGWAPRKRD